MPTYEYACRSCGEHHDVVQSFGDEPLASCPTCGGPVRKVFGAVGVVFKGSGFYKTDSRSTSKASGDRSDKSDRSDTSEKSDKSAASDTPAASGGKDGAAAGTKATEGSAPSGGSTSPSSSSGSKASSGKAAAAS